MNLKKLIANKYSVSIILLLALLFTDVLLHRGETRMLITGTVDEKIKPYQLPLCENALITENKKWVTGIFSIPDIRSLPADIAGIYLELELIDKHAYQVAVKKFTGLSLDSVISAVQSVARNCSFSFEIPETNTAEQAQIFSALKKIEQQFQLKGKMIVAAKNATTLKSFCDSGFNTAYIVPPFDPYNSTVGSMQNYCDNIATQLSASPASALLTNLKKYPLLRKAFPTLKLITTAGNEDLSIVGYFTKRQLEKDSMVAVTLFER